jgi:nicotinate (nicotinamide) nucleotide adenylyltransferase
LGRAIIDNLHHPVAQEPMEREEIRRTAVQTASKAEPSIKILKRAPDAGLRIGVFSSSFNPITAAHLRIIEEASRQFKLDEMLALIGTANADKSEYACSIENRLEMLLLSVTAAPNLSVGLSNTAFFVDMIDPLRTVYGPARELFFVVGIDTFERILDREGRYHQQYQGRFSDRAAALDYLQSKSHMIVAGRQGRGNPEIRELLAEEPGLNADRILYLDAPAEIAERSATEVRERVACGVSVRGLVPPVVEHYILEHRLYRE